MRVGLLCSYLDDYGLTGPNIYLINLIEHLLQEDEIDLYLIHYRRSDNPIFKKANEIIIPRVLGELKLREYDLDIIHFNTIPKRDGVFFPLLKAKKVATVHGDEHWFVPSLDRHPYLVPLKRLVEPISSKFLDAIIAVSYDLKNRIANHLNIPRSKIHVTHLASRDIFRPPKNSEKDYIKRKYNIEKPFLLHVSNLQPSKNPQTILRTFNLLIKEGFKLELVIAGKRWNNDAVKKLISKPNLNNNVRILGFVPQEDLALLYGSAEVFFQPSFHENFPQTLVEAMSCGTPVVTSDIYSIPEVTGNAGILHDPRDYVGFVGSIKKILSNSKYRKKLQDRVLDNAKRFSWEKTTRETIEVYKKLMTTDSPKG